MLASEKVPELWNRSSSPLRLWYDLTPMRGGGRAFDIAPLCRVGGNADGTQGSGK